MGSIRSNIESIKKDQRGFTLPELLTTIAIMGILLAIAIIIWLALLEQRRVDAAINQLAADLRLAHSSATNQLTDWRLVYAHGSPDYQLRKLNQPCDDDLGCGTPTVIKTVSRSLPEGTKLFDSTNSTQIIELNSDGTGRALSGPSATVRVSSTDDDPKRSLTFAAATARVEVVP